jgi:hypothetical protein
MDVCTLGTELTYVRQHTHTHTPRHYGSEENLLNLLDKPAHLTN